MAHDQVLPILEVRMALEVQSAGLAAARRAPENLAELTRIIAAMEADLPEGLHSEPLDLAFHLELAKATQNQLLDRLMNTVQDTISSTLHTTRALWLSASAGTVSQLFEQHRAIYEAVKTGDQLASRELMYDHLAKVEKRLNGLGELVES
jgi:GntR family transcriptional repressor for pyruvate dehydrogenase complex